MDADFSFLMGKNLLVQGITQKQALELLHVLDMYKTTPKNGRVYLDRRVSILTPTSYYTKTEIQVYPDKNKSMFNPLKICKHGKR